MLAAEWIFLGCSMAVFAKGNDRKIRWIVAVAIIMVGVESLGFYIRTVLRVSNHQIYNISIPLIIVLYHLLFLQQLEIKSNRSIVRILAILFIAFAIVNLVFIQKFDRLGTYSYMVGAVFLVISACLYFLELARKPVSVSLRRESMFFIASAVVLQYLPKSVLFAVFEYLAYKSELNKIFGDVYHASNLVLGAIYFSLLSYACICRLIFR